eukprot:CAMPEP_0115651266 /NCGR_PEP_ID=MMETSP0272-20121206/41461_1 /TAXON_ID=71861 /ORGANISM="Scrippsiella trochoidea, Strain CCMP3099" /LENGTH=158 /DNA_ID=CAMNT_0003089027 /DNA_START=1075 /DNA_END=1549 /DNA_ORIENTATION=-
MPEANVKNWVAALCTSQYSEVGLPLGHPRSGKYVLISAPPLQGISQDLGSSVHVSLPAPQVDLYCLCRAPRPLPSRHLATRQQIFGKRNDLTAFQASESLQIEASLLVGVSSFKGTRLCRSPEQQEIACTQVRSIAATHLEGHPLRQMPRSETARACE